MEYFEIKTNSGHNFTIYGKRKNSKKGLTVQGILIPLELKTKKELGYYFNKNELLFVDDGTSFIKKVETLGELIDFVSTKKILKSNKTFIFFGARFERKAAEGVTK